MITTFNSIPKPHQSVHDLNGIYSDPSTNIADTRTTDHGELYLCNESCKLMAIFLPLLTIPFNNANNKNDAQAPSCHCCTIGSAHCSQYWRFKVGFSQAITNLVHCERKSSLSVSQLILFLVTWKMFHRNWDRVKKLPFVSESGIFLSLRINQCPELRCMILGYLLFLSVFSEHHF